MPYTYDIPNFTMSVTTSNGAVDLYSEKYNSGLNVFYASSLAALAFVCDSLAEGVPNTACTITFKPSQIIQPRAVLYVTFTGAKVAADTCTLIASSGITWTAVTPITCASSIDSSQIVVALLSDKADYINTNIYQVMEESSAEPTNLTLSTAALLPRRVAAVPDYRDAPVCAASNPRQNGEVHH